ncbi:MAG: hypothetical protein HZB41_10665 [Ignavibacteriae bacterium]|nr:hypothetical protein [Ignavibacteriota bacterium]
MKKLNLFRIFSFTLIIASLLTLFTGCKSDNPTNPNPNDVFTAKVDDAVVLDFSANLTSVILTKQQQNNYVARTIVASMTSGGNTYMITLIVNDDGKGAGSYNIETEGFASLSVAGNADLTFLNEVRGQITLTELDDKNWEGSFNFDAYNSNKTKKIKVFNGHLNVHK